MTGSGSGPGERGSSSGMRGRMLGPVQCAADFADPARVCDRLGTNVSRRRLLAGLLAGGATVSVLPAACASARSGDARLAAADSGAVVSTFFSDPGINFQMLFALGAAGYGASEVGEVKELTSLPPRARSSTASPWRRSSGTSACSTGSSGSSSRASARSRENALRHGSPPGTADEGRRQSSDGSRIFSCASAWFSSASNNPEASSPISRLTVRIAS